MSDWGGFSDAELRHLRSGGDSKAASAKPSPKTQPKSNLKKALAAKKTSNRKPKKIHEDALLPTANISQDGQAKVDTTVIESSAEEIRVPEIIEEETVIEEKKKLEIAEVDKAQKEMEEKNKRRRAALAQEVISRQKKAAIESKMLTTIQEELVKLDNLLNADVAILRDQIDVACVEFSEANRRFHAAEKEYVESKFDLQKKTETKDTLTEHLMELIQMNEERKQKKLEELTFKLSMDPEIVSKREAEAAEKIRIEEEAKLKAIEDAKIKSQEDQKIKSEKEESDKSTENGVSPSVEDATHDNSNETLPITTAPTSEKGLSSTSPEN